MGIYGPYAAVNETYAAVPIRRIILRGPRAGHEASFTTPYENPRRCQIRSRRHGGTDAASSPEIKAPGKYKTCDTNKRVAVSDLGARVHRPHHTPWPTRRRPSVTHDSGGGTEQGLPYAHRGSETSHRAPAAGGARAARQTGHRVNKTGSSFVDPARENTKLIGIACPVADSFRVICPKFCLLGPNRRGGAHFPPPWNQEAHDCRGRISAVFAAASRPPSAVWVCLTEMGSLCLHEALSGVTSSTVLIFLPAAGLPTHQEKKRPITTKSQKKATPPSNSNSNTRNSLAVEVELTNHHARRPSQIPLAKSAAKKQENLPENPDPIDQTDAYYYSAPRGPYRTQARPPTARTRRQPGPSQAPLAAARLPPSLRMASQATSKKSNRFAAPPPRARTIRETPLRPRLTPSIYTPTRARPLTMAAALSAVGSVVFAGEVMGNKKARSGKAEVARCRRHPRHHRQQGAGVCACCLRERLSGLSLPESLPSVVRGGGEEEDACCYGGEEGASSCSGASTGYSTDCSSAASSEYGSPGEEEPAFHDEMRRAARVSLLMRHERVVGDADAVAVFLAARREQRRKATTSFWAKLIQATRGGGGGRKEEACSLAAARGKAIEERGAAAANKWVLF
ncbi:hypothetical protein HU200_002142 [Digitaria exilis]|uniref:Uncharacterized protein n=1 Tax=Digitaria exilis TaxID=1010633 RepID=A0A835KZI0_9POAL|nr:hypothetical protein HU200_002142 [Digitaria exilis]